MLGYHNIYFALPDAMSLTKCRIGKIDKNIILKFKNKIIYDKIYLTDNIIINLCFFIFINLII